MRILIVLTPALDPTAGGVQMSTVKLANMLGQFGHEIRVFSFENDGHVTQSNFEILCAPASGGVREAQNILALKQQIIQFCPDVAINQMPYEHAIGDALKAFDETVRIGCLHNTLFSVASNLDHYAERLLPSQLWRIGKTKIGLHILLRYHKQRHARDLSQIIDCYDRFVLLSEKNCEELSFFIPNYPEKKIAVIPHSVDEIASQVPHKKRRILWLGRVVRHQKRADRIIPLWKRLSNLLPEWSLDVVGDGDLLFELKELSKRESLSRIQFHGQQMSRSYFEDAAVFVMTSDFEAWGLTLTEAQSAGTVPVLFDSFSMAGFLVNDRVNGVLVQSGNIDRMIEEIYSLCNNSEQRFRMAREGLESVKRFETSIVAKEWNKLIQLTVSERRKIVN